MLIMLKVEIQLSPIKYGYIRSQALVLFLPVMWTFTYIPLSVDVMCIPRLCRWPAYTF